MKIAIPSNIYSAFFALSLKDEYKSNIYSKPSSLLANELESGDADVAIIPSMDLLKHKELFISGKTGISFDGYLSNSYLYFKPNQNDFKNLFIQGDVSSNEVILSKIIFAEMYDSEVEIKLDTHEIEIDENNYLICGDTNHDKKIFNKGLSFSDEVAELLDYPYTNYVLASKNETNLEELSSSLQNIDKTIEDNMDSYLQSMNLGFELNSIIKENINTVYYEITDNELTGLNELLRLPYFHGVIEDVVDLKIV